MLFKNGNSAATATAKVVKEVAPPVILTLYQQGNKNYRKLQFKSSKSNSSSISGGKASGVFIRLAGISGATAVALGAYGAHKKEWPLPDNLNRDPRAVFEVANKYHFYNSLALLAIPLVKRPWLTGSMMTAGIVLFTGTCYYASLTGDQRFNRLAPLGGTTLILAWLSMALF